MYHYELINNHYVVTIEGKRYLIDTGCQRSFALPSGPSQVTIDGKIFALYSKPSNVDVTLTYACIGTEVDGFIGMDILLKTSLTIHKNGTLEFESKPLEGKEIPLTIGKALVCPVEYEGKQAHIILDTGAKYGYGSSEVFRNRQSFGYREDYNPELGKLTGAIYHIPFTFAGKEVTLDLCWNPAVGFIADMYRVLGFANVTELFQETLVFAFEKRRITLK